MIGIHYGLPEDAYHASEGVSATMLKTLAMGTPAHLKHYMTHGREDTPAMRFGRLIHRAVLEPDRMDSEYIVSPKIDKRTKEGKALYAEFLVKAQGREIVDQDEMDKIRQIVDSVHSQSEARDLLSHGKKEVSIFGIDPITGLTVKARIDILAGTAMTDIKSVEDASDWGFSGQLTKMFWHIQTPHYAAVGELVKIKVEYQSFMAIEKKAPFLCNVVWLNNESIERGFELRQRMMAKIKECKDKNEWPGYGAAHEIGIRRYGLTDKEAA